MIGTTGFDIEGLRAIAEADRASTANVFIAPNFAIGAVLMMRFAVEAAGHMPRAEIIELHPRRQARRSREGAAARTAELMAAASGREPPPIHSVRLPGLVANQEVIFGDTGQTLTIRHDTTGREALHSGSPPGRAPGRRPRAAAPGRPGEPALLRAAARAWILPTNEPTRDSSHGDRDAVRRGRERQRRGVRCVARPPPRRERLRRLRRRRHHR